MTGHPLFLGMQSGTSLDGIDAVLVDFDSSPGTARVLASSCTPYPTEVAATVRTALEHPDRLSVAELGRLDARLGDLFAAAARALVEDSAANAADVAAIGSHGQTVQHGPEAAPPFTMQLGEPARIAEATRLPVVAHFRTRDVAAGGQGAPLAPALHAALLRAPASRPERRAVLNLGGVANLTLLPERGDDPVEGFDTGPANSLSDAWSRACSGKPFDDRGAWAASGTVHRPLLEALIAHPYFAAEPPKSTGPETFNLRWVRDTFDVDALDQADVQATLVELTARSVAQALQRYFPGCRRLLVCGGGVRNDHLMARLAKLTAPCEVESTQAHGLDPAWVEAILFAWLARQHLAGEPGNLPEVTGAAGPRVLGARYLP